MRAQPAPRSRPAVDIARRCRGVTAQDRDRSRLRHDRHDRGRKAHARAQGRHLLFLQPKLPDQVRRRPRPLSGRESRRTRARGAGGHDLHLPDGSGDPAGRTGHLSDLRHGAGAGAVQRGRRSQPRARRHDAPVLDRARADVAGVPARDGQPHLRHVGADLASCVGLGPVRARHAGGAVGRLAVLRARLAVACRPATSTCSR